MRNSRIPTFFAIFILLIGVGSIVFTINQVQGFRSGASGGSIPQDVRITNIRDTSATVSYITDKPSIGIIEYSNQTGQVFESSATNLSVTHYITLQNLTPSAIYNIRINSAGTFFDNNGSNWQVQTTSTGSNLTDSIVSGKVLNKENFPAKDAIVYITADVGLAASSQVSDSGNFIASLPALPDSTILQILVEASPSLVANAKIDLKSANPIPTMILGGLYDFEKESTPSASNLPVAPIQLPY